MMAPDIELRPDERIVELTWDNGERNRYHYVWLRHSARCVHGMPNDTSVKIDLLPDDPSALAIETCCVEDSLLVIDWRDAGLQTRHELTNLRNSAYDDAHRLRRKHRPSLWQRDDAERIPRLDFASTQTREGLLELMLAVRDYGVAKVYGVPTEPGSLRQVARGFGPLHVNNYGEVFDVKSDAHLNLGSNTGVYLPPHTDESYRHDAPGISFFHCLLAAPEGGESILVDGFMAAERLRVQDPASFELLCNVPVFFQRYALPQEDMRSHTRMLVTDVDGEVVGCRWTDRTLPPQDLPADLVEPVYRAIRRLWRIINDDSLQHCYRLSPGELHVFDNHRVLHGRLGFDPAAGPRHLQQCSVNRDEFHNRLRVLAAELDHPAANLVMAGGAVG